MSECCGDPVRAGKLRLVLLRSQPGRQALYQSMPRSSGEDACHPLVGLPGAANIRFLILAEVTEGHSR
jgi:hypothetical protein